MRKALVGLTTATALLGSMFLLAPSASAATASPAGAYGCSGSQIGTYDATYAGTVFSTVHLYYDSSLGMNCAVNVATAAGGYDSSTLKGVKIWRCVAGSTPGTVCQTDGGVIDMKDYLYYAGPVAISAAGRCVLVEAWDSATNGHEAYLDTHAVHCG